MTEQYAFLCFDFHQSNNRSQISMPYHGWESRRSHLVVFEVLTLSGSQWSEWTNSHSVQTQKCAPWTAVLSCRRQRESSRRLPLRCISICSFRMARMKYTDMISQATRLHSWRLSLVSLRYHDWIHGAQSLLTTNIQTIIWHEEILWLWHLPWHLLSPPDSLDVCSSEGTCQSRRSSGQQVPL